MTQPRVRKPRELRQNATPDRADLDNGWSCEIEVSETRNGRV